LETDTVVANLNIFAPDVDPEPAALELASRYMRLMSDRVKMHVSKAATKKWQHCFHMLLKQFTEVEITKVIDVVELHMPRVNYTRTETLREQFGPLAVQARRVAPHLFVELPVLPVQGRWEQWAVTFARDWPAPTTPADAVTALRMQLHIFETCHGGRLGWPVAACWLTARAKQWRGWQGCPPVLSRGVYWWPDCKDVDLLEGVVEPSIAKRIRSGNYAS
jgi:hypothetical protein